MFDTFKFFKIIPQQTIGVLERFGKYKRNMLPGLNFKIPFVDNISYIHSLKEESVQVERQMAITKDNVSLEIDGVLFIKIEDAYKASYSIEDPHEAVKLLTLTLLRSEIGKIELDNLFQERQRLNTAILRELKQCTDIWGISCLRYEILNIDPPEEIKKSMQQEAEAERNKRRQILISEGKRQSEINIAEGEKNSTIQRAQGQAESIIIKTEKEAQAIQLISNSLQENSQAANYILSQSYLQKFRENIKSSNVVVYPENPSGQQDLMGLASVLWMQNSTQNITPQEAIKPIQLTPQPEKVVKRTEKPVDRQKKYEDPILESTDEDKP